ncbi:MAG: dihydropteroate synthase [Sulfurimonas sp.]|jgi:dihydropteroate synthase|nr:dihydropteroate synthase [Sulfurimonas sp.]
MQVEKLSNTIDLKRYLAKLGVDGGGIDILASKATSHLLLVRKMHVGAANILKQDALSIGADLAVPRGTVIAKEKYVDCLLIATQKQLQTLARKELAQPFGLKELAKRFKHYASVQTPRDVELMGVLNANDDSFFSKSRFEAKNAREKIEKMIEDGADIIDIGGVSSRPNSVAVSPKEELARVQDVCDIIKEHKLYEKVKFSLDSYEPSVISYALESGFSIVNDITGLANDAVCRLCAQYNAKAVIMHMQGTPQTMQESPHYENILTEVGIFFEQRIQKAESFGVKDIILDVGIGFGKTLEHNLMLLCHLEHFLVYDKPLLVGASRKSMIDAISPAKIEERLGGTLAIHLESLRNGASIIRAHDVAEHHQAIKVYQAIHSL